MLSTGISTSQISLPVLGEFRISSSTVLICLVFLRWLLGKVKSPVPGDQGCISLTRDCPDGFLHLLGVLSDVINDNITLQQVHEKVFSRDSLKKKVDSHVSQESNKVTLIFRWEWQFPNEICCLGSPTGNICRRIFLFKVKFWLSTVYSFQVTKFMKIAGNRWIRKLHNDLRYYFCMLFKPRFRRKELEHTGRKCVRHLKQTQALCKFLWATIDHESLRSADKWLMWIISESSKWN